MTLRYLPRAVRDISAIADYVAERNPAAARSVEMRIRAAAELLGEYPEIGRKLEQRPEVRVLPVARYPYLVFYSVSGKDVLIVHVRHSARKPVDPDEL